MLQQQATRLVNVLESLAGGYIICLAIKRIQKIMIRKPKRLFRSNSNTIFSFFKDISTCWNDQQIHWKISNFSDDFAEISNTSFAQLTTQFMQILSFNKSMSQTIETVLFNSKTLNYSNIQD